MARRALLTTSILASSLFAVATAFAEGPCPVALAPGATSGTADEIYERARTAFDAQRFDAAATLFAAVAHDHPESGLGIYAATLSLAALEKASPRCTVTTGQWVGRYRALYCHGSSEKQQSNAEIDTAAACASLAAIDRDVTRLTAEEAVALADKQRGAEARSLYLSAGDTYMRIWQTDQADACKRSDVGTCRRAEEILHNAARAFTAGRDFARAISVYSILTDPQFHLHELELAKLSRYAIGGLYFATAEYSLAADWYERFATASPKAENALEALTDAIVLRLMLKDLPRAEAGAAQWEKLYAAKRTREHASVILAVATTKAEVADSPRDVEKLLASRSVALAAGAADQQPIIDLLWANALAAQGKTAEARKLFARAASFDVGRAVQSLSAAAEDRRDRSLGRTLTAIGKARLWLADQARDGAMKRSVKKGDKASLDAKREAVAAAEKLYGEVLKLQPIAPPEPSVEATARVARLRGQLWAQAHIAFGAATSDMFLQQAKAAYVGCVDLGAKLQVTTAGSAACARWLTKHYPLEYPAIAELGAKPVWSAPGFAPPRPLDDDNEEHVSTRAPALSAAE